MILDYNFNKFNRTMTVSYVKDNGQKSLINFNVDKFKSYYLTPTGKYTNWDGQRCDVKYVSKPGLFDMKTFMEELPEQYKKLFRGKRPPKLYTFDIEVSGYGDEFPNPAEAKFPIVNISIANENCDVIVLGLRDIDSAGMEYINKEFHKYLEMAKYFRETGLPMPKFQYVKFDSEEQMIQYFLKNIIANAAVIAGWNSILFDWQYIQNRINYYYQNISLKSCSKDGTLHRKKFVNQRGDAVRLMMPNHTLILDMMDTIGQFDYTVMPIKESLALDYIAGESIGMRKIKYDGDLEKLYDENYPKYVFYNAIDSVLVQLIDKKFRTLQNIYTQALYCRERIESCFSKIALAEALVFNDYYEHGIKVVDNYEEVKDRGTLVGAYVRQPVPGLYKFICCNDFASLYPSTIITCNLSYDNYIGNYADDETTLSKYRNNPDYFVSVNGSIYKNDKDYSFKRIQAALKANRNTGKYLAKQLDAEVMADLDHIIENRKPENRTYSERLIKAIEEIGYNNINCTNDLYNIPDKEEFKTKLGDEIMFYITFEQSMKLLGNSMYGGSSHPAFFWFNIYLANDITGEARNLIHLMEAHIPDFFQRNWMNLTELHKKLGITVDSKEFEKISKKSQNLLQIIYGDTDSLYISYENLIKTVKNLRNASIDEICKFIVKLNTEFLDGHNESYMDEYYKKRFAKSIHKFELETVALSGVWLDVKKRYAQILLWKDGRYFDADKLPMKIKGLEMVKSSVPTQARGGLKRMVRYLLESDNNDFILQRLNIKMQEELQDWNKADIEDVCGNMNVRKYAEYMIDDANPNGLIVESKCPANVKALGNYNRIRNIYNLPGDPIYGGKIKWYMYCPLNGRKSKNMKDNMEYFGFQSTNYPKWADEYAPISRSAMFQQFMLDPFNRIINAIGLNSLVIDGSIQMSLF